MVKLTPIDKRDSGLELSICWVFYFYFLRHYSLISCITVLLIILQIMSMPSCALRARQVKIVLNGKQMCFIAVCHLSYFYFLIWAFPFYFAGFIFIFSWCIVWLHLINFTMVNNARKQERRRKSMLWPGIWTRPAQTECICSTACATAR